MRVPGAIQFRTAQAGFYLEQAFGMQPDDRRLDSLRSTLESIKPSTSQVAVEAAELAAAIRLLRSIYAESVRVRNLGNGDITGQLLGTPGAQMDLRYQLALGRAVRDISAEPVLPQVIRTLRFERKLTPYPEQFANYTDLFGAGISAVSSSQIHYGTPEEIYIEDQPQKRGNYISTFTVACGAGK